MNARRRWDDCHAVNTSLLPKIVRISTAAYSQYRSAPAGTLSIALSPDTARASSRPSRRGRRAASIRPVASGVAHRARTLSFPGTTPAPSRRRPSSPGRERELFVKFPWLVAVSGFVTVCVGTPPAQKPFSDVSRGHSFSICASSRRRTRRRPSWYRRGRGNRRGRARGGCTRRSGRHARTFSRSSPPAHRLRSTSFWPASSPRTEHFRELPERVHDVALRDAIPAVPRRSSV